MRSLTTARITKLLADHYHVHLTQTGLRVTHMRLSDLDLDSLSRMSFIAELEQEFSLDLSELKFLARCDCTLMQLSQLCRAALARSVARKAVA